VPRCHQNLSRAFSTRQVDENLAAVLSLNDTSEVYPPFSAPARMGIRTFNSSQHTGTFGTQSCRRGSRRPLFGTPWRAATTVTLRHYHPPAHHPHQHHWPEAPAIEPTATKVLMINRKIQQVIPCYSSRTAGTQRPSTAPKFTGATHIMPRFRSKALYYSVGAHRWACSHAEIEAIDKDI